MSIPTAALAAISLGVGAAGAGFQAFTSAEQARQQNRYQRKQAAAQREANRIRSGQVSAASELEMEKARDEAHQLESRIRVAAGESGLGITGDTAEALTRQVGLDLESNVDIIKENERLEIQSTNSRQFFGRRQNALLSGLSGGLSGLGAGLSLGSSALSINRDIKAGN